jgi:hypothetical protein
LVNHLMIEEGVAFGVLKEDAVKGFHQRIEMGMNHGADGRAPAGGFQAGPTCRNSFPHCLPDSPHVSIAAVGGGLSCGS